MKLSKEQVNVFIKKGQEMGLTGKDVIDTLVAKGHEPEGVNVQVIKQSMVSKQTPTITPVTTPAPETTVMDRVSSNIQKKGEQVYNAATDTSRSTLGKITGTGAALASSISSTAYEALPDSARGVLDSISKVAGKGVDELVNYISDNKSLQEAAMSGNTKKLEEGLKIVADIGTIAGETAGVMGVTKGLNKTVDLAKKGLGTAKNVATKTVSDLTPDDLAKYPRQIGEKIQDKLTTLEPQVKNVLKTTSVEKFDNMVNYGKEAMSNPRVLTPIEQAGEVVKNKILPTIKGDLNNIGAQKAKSLAPVAKVQVPNATLDTIDYIKNTTKGMDLTTDESKLINQALSELERGTNPTIGTIDKTIDKLYSTLFEKKGGVAIPVTPRVQSIINQSINKLNTTLKASVKKALGGSDEFSALNDAYSTRKNVFNTINKLIKEEGKGGGSFINRFYSKADTGIKKTFAQIKDLYGVDLAEDATLAKFVMDSLGDTRAQAYLGTVPLTKSGLATKVVNYAYQKVQNPIKKARKTIVESQVQSK